MFWSGYGPNRSGRIRSYLHSHGERPKDEAVEAVFNTYSALTSLRLDQVKLTETFRDDFDQNARVGCIMHNALKILIELEDGSFGTTTIPGINIDIFENGEIPNPPPQEILDLVQLFINNDLSPKVGVPIRRYVKGVFCIIEAINQLSI